jgi:hypothetical protein
MRPRRPDTKNRRLSSKSRGGSTVKNVDWIAGMAGAMAIAAILWAAIAFA